MFRGALADGDLRLLRVFKTVVDHGGFTAAEVALNKSKSAISLDMSHLEERLGARLCTRGRSGFTLTEEGQIVYMAAMQLFTDIDRFRDRVAAATRHLSGKVTLFMVDNMVSAAAAPLTGALAEFCRRHADVELRVESAAAGGVERAVLDGEADLGITVVPRAVPTLEMIPLFREQLRLYCGSPHPLFLVPDDRITASDVTAHALIRPSVMDDPTFWALISSFRSTAQASNLDARVLLILSGLHLGFLPPHYARSFVDQGELREIMPTHFRTENTFHLILKKSANLSVAARQFLRTVLAAFEP